MFKTFHFRAGYPSMIQRLFVYGSLAPGRVNEHLLDGIDGTWEKATVRGTLYEEGWGATMGYPAIVLDESGDRVDGFLFRSEQLSDHWERLDAFEGEAYRRVVASVMLSDQSNVEAYIYALNQNP